MPDKKTKEPVVDKDDKKKEEKKDERVAHQVIEIVEDEDASVDTKEPKIEPQKVEVVEEKVDKEEEKKEEVKKEEKKTSPKPPENTEKQEPEQAPDHDRQQEVVKELFRKKESVIDNEITEHKKKTPKALVLSLGIVLAVAFLVSGSLITIFGGSLPEVSVPSIATPTSTPEPTETPAPTPEEVSVEDVSVQVLNGSGVSGAAGKMKALLEGLEYTVSDTGNADSFDYEQTEVSVKKGQDELLKKVVTDISSDYTVGEQNTTIDEESSYDIQIIVGKE